MDAVSRLQIINGAYSEQLGSDYSEPVKPVWGGEDVGTYTELLQLSSGRPS